MQMPFGKHKGERIEDLPTDYLEWCVKNMDEKRNASLLEEMDAQLRMRNGEGVSRGKADRR
jgi:uncharacterized protein (DUF3820 family)